MTTTPPTAPDGTITFANAGDLSRWLRHWQEKSWAAGRREVAEEIALAIEARESFAHGNNPTSEAHLIGFGTMQRIAARIAREVGERP